MSFFGSRRQVEPVPPSSGADNPPQPARSPAPPTPSPSPVGFETVLGANSTLEGTLRSSANVRLDGTFTGTLEISGNILVGETAKINADINARNISIAGAVRGNITGKKIQILRTGRVWGDIRAAALTTEEGAFIDGKITMISHEAAAPAEPLAAVEPPVSAEPLAAVEPPVPAEPPAAVDEPGDQPAEDLLEGQPDDLTAADDDTRQNDDR